VIAVPKNPTLVTVFDENTSQKVKKSHINGTNQPQTILTTRISGLVLKRSKNGNANTAQATNKPLNRYETATPPGKEKSSNNIWNLSKVNNCATTNITNTIAYIYAICPDSLVLGCFAGVVFVNNFISTV
jgi:hypothetical protein